MSHPVITVDNLSKYYRLGETASSGGALSSLTSLFKPRSTAQTTRDLWALKDVSFEVPRGQVTGIIGRNGAGKSTLLKILSRITDPTSGSATIHGRVGSLLEVGTGFHPELTGRENVFLNGSILGMARSEIERKFNEIVEFSEIGIFIDTPVKRYSSGMYTRLAFSVAANLDPEILIIDEVLSVGDAAFQKKCLVKINHLMRSGRTVLFVSHNIGSINELCNSAVLLHKGRMVKSGGVSETIEEYTKLIAESSTTQNETGYHGDGVSLNRIAVTKSDGTPETVFDLNDEIVLNFEYQVHKPLETLQLCIVLSRNMIELFSSFDTDGLEMPLIRRDPGRYRASFHISPGSLKAGGYSVATYLGTMTDLLLEVPASTQFTIEELSENTAYRGYRRERLGHIVAPGLWDTVEL
ncbi:ABC transporter ATP-binding protein [Rhizobium sp. J15]|uniref:ABC transporter ATP-binding protein n=1 Tax=Rhizobium sp. J15 TaxID=2035450 RepID=UPI000BE8E786|nr:ABC transporter ATP-binding protein [Rhizobium sp. J15]PDT18286.1 ABC transporter ATP-binding protein [Rhizobium sp. J15]